MKQLTLLIAFSTLVGIGSGFSTPAQAQGYYYDSPYSSYQTYVNPYNQGYYNNPGYYNSYQVAPYRNRRYTRSYGYPYNSYNYDYRYNNRRSGGRIAADILNQIF